jgi:hypothetical protein
MRMAKHTDTPGGSWPLVEELLERGDPDFVDELRKITDADRLGAFASPWYDDPRPTARRFLLDYLSRPLNALRHEPLVKRLFKRAEKAEDDEVMAAFLLALDRSVRRVKRKRFRWDRETRASWHEEVLAVPPGTAMPRPKHPRPHPQFETLRLFSVRTRAYLRRRAWRYFRLLGQRDVTRYLAAIGPLLKKYTDEDTATGLALLDNWGLVHILYHHSPVLISKASGWVLAPERTLAELQPAPLFPEAWRTVPDVLLSLLEEARCRPVRQWAIFLLKRNHRDMLARLPAEKLVAWLGHKAPEMVALAAEVLRGGADLGRVRFDRWLTLLDTDIQQTLDLLAGLMADHFPAERVPVGAAVAMACKRQKVLARLGFDWLRRKSITGEDDCRALFGLREAEADDLRPEMIAWARGVLAASPDFQPEWVLEFLDHRHADVRAAGWKWLREDGRVRENVLIWQRLLESPFDDVRLQLVAHLEERAPAERQVPDRGRLDPEMVRLLWASVLLNVHRGSRQKPWVVRQMVERLTRKPEEAGVLLPILAVALRSVRGPEWRAGLAGIVTLAERHPELEPQVRAAFPELRLQPLLPS